MDLYTVLGWWHTSHAPLQQLSSTQFVQHVLFSGHSPPPVSFTPLSFSLHPSSLVPSPPTPSLKNPRYFPPLLCILYSSSNWIFITPIPFRHTTERYTIKRNDNVLTLLSMQSGSKTNGNSSVYWIILNGLFLVQTSGTTSPIFSRIWRESPPLPFLFLPSPRLLL